MIRAIIPVTRSTLTSPELMREALAIKALGKCALLNACFYRTEAIPGKMQSTLEAGHDRRAPRITHHPVIFACM